MVVTSRGSDTVPHMADDEIRDTLFEIMTIVREIDQRLTRLEALEELFRSSGEPVWSDDTQSVLPRVWDAVAQRWIYSPEGS